MAFRYPLRTLTLIALLAVGSNALVAPVHAADRATRASEFYEDALARMQKGDANGAVVQLKNALQQDNKMLPALVLLGEAYLKTGAPLGAERVLADAERLGADRSQIIAMQVET